ncbi:PQQ-like beta-propeller repeat protein [Saccharomonospora xinjiangensis]|uniref:PQQ-like beta-propeller repeat protein n=1 Tax=Saccharomonospora xinjiangensis TaxID=75294 RepID=UPI001FFD583C|nr:PQQ-like beta-propeller repeat protein [Saccharomonospora xinjiangensis]
MVLVVTAAVLVACGGAPGGAGGAGDRGHESGQNLPIPDVSTTSRAATPPPGDLAAPGPGDAPALWKAPFDDVPRTGGGMFVGLVFPADDEADLSITGVAADGTTRWAVRTNPSCVGYGLTRVADTTAAVVLASDADNREGKVATRTSANAFDVRDGSRLWGPTPVPGPMVGPGLIFGTNTPSIVGGQQGERVMLAAGSGAPVTPPSGDAVAVYEHHGTGLFSENGVLTAIDTATSEVRWSSATVSPPFRIGESGGKYRVELLDAASASTGDVVALRWTPEDGSRDGGGEGDGDRGAETALHDLRTGAVIATLGDQPELRTIVDAGKGAVVVSGLDRFRTTLAFDLGTGKRLWRDTGSLDLTLAHAGTAYGTRAGRSVAVDVRTGKTVADGEWAVPVAAEDGVLVAPLPQPREARVTERTEGSGPGYVAHEQR